MKQAKQILTFIYLEMKSLSVTLLRSFLFALRIFLRRRSKVHQQNSILRRKIRLHVSTVIQLSRIPEAVINKILVFFDVINWCLPTCTILTQGLCCLLLPLLGKTTYCLDFGCCKVDCNFKICFHHFHE